MKPDVIKNDKLSSALWDYYRGKLDAASKWKEEYAPHFAVLIEAVARWLDVTAELAQDGNRPTLVNPKRGTIYRNPLLDIQSQHANTIQRYGAAFGMNPLADAKIKSAATDGLGELLKLMQGDGSA